MLFLIHSMSMLLLHIPIYTKFYTTNFGILCSSRIFSMHSCTTPASNEIPEVASLTILLMFVAVCTRVFATPMPPSTYHSQPHQKHLVLKVLGTKHRNGNNLASRVRNLHRRRGRERARERTKGRTFLIYFQHHIAEALLTLHKGY